MHFLCKNYFKLFFHSASVDLVKLVTYLVKQLNQAPVNCRMEQSTECGQASLKPMIILNSRALPLSPGCLKDPS